MFPAWAGMNREHTGKLFESMCVPRVGGDEPAYHDAMAAFKACSPRGRG